MTKKRSSAFGRPMGWVALLVGLLCLAGCASSDSSDGMSDSSVPELPDKPLLSELNRVEQSLFWRVNDERRKGGLMPLTLKADLCRAARKHNFEMMQVGIVSHFSHEGLDIGQQLTAQGIPWNLCAENLAKMPDTKDVAQKTVEFWMSEPTGEKDILFHLYNETGLAAQKDPKTGEWFITQIYARRIGYWVP